MITGGAGGLGQLFAQHISKTIDTKVILSGRRTGSSISEDALQGMNATYHSCDVTNKEAVEDLIKVIIAEYGRLDGIIHSAGLIRDSFLKNKTKEESKEVLSPKILGVQNLDRATKGIALDFMVYCSSVAGVMGNVGQADYSSANAYMDRYARFRNDLVIKVLGFLFSQTYYPIKSIPGAFENFSR